MAGPDFTPTRREHAAIVETVRRGRAHALERAVRTNWLNAAQRLGPLIDRFDGRLPAAAPVFSISASLAEGSLADEPARGSLRTPREVAEQAQ
jgi:hypothetical protein